MNREEIDEFIIKEKDIPISGHQRIYRFPNNYGASCVDGPALHSYSFHTEIAIFEFRGDKVEITCDTGITNDVIITDDEDDELEYLNRIYELKEL